MVNPLVCVHVSRTWLVAAVVSVAIVSAATVVAPIDLIPAAGAANEPCPASKTVLGDKDDREKDVTFSCVVPTGKTRMKVDLVGPGGGGGGGGGAFAYPESRHNSGGGGGGGGAVVTCVLTVTAGQTVTVRAGKFGERGKGSFSGSGKNGGKGGDGGRSTVTLDGAEVAVAQGGFGGEGGFAGSRNAPGGGGIGGIGGPEEVSSCTGASRHITSGHHGPSGRSGVVDDMRDKGVGGGPGIDITQPPGSETTACAAEANPQYNPGQGGNGGRGADSDSGKGWDAALTGVGCVAFAFES